MHMKKVISKCQHIIASTYLTCFLQFWRNKKCLHALSESPANCFKLCNSITQSIIVTVALHKQFDLQGKTKHSNKLTLWTKWKNDCTAFHPQIRTTAFYTLESVCNGQELFSFLQPGLWSFQPTYGLHVMDKFQGFLSWLHHTWPDFSHRVPFSDTCQAVWKKHYWALRSWQLLIQKACSSVLAVPEPAGLDELGDSHMHSCCGYS